MNADAVGNIAEYHFVDAGTLAKALAARIADDLRTAIAQTHTATLAVSGGTTPQRFLEALRQQPLEWSRLTITLADERWVPRTNPRSNERMVRATLLRDQAAQAGFVPLYADAPTPEAGLATVAASVGTLALPFAAVVLGLGDDGHCASLFADGDHIAQALDPTGVERVLPMRSPSAAEARITLTLPALIATRRLYLHIQGADKLQVLRRVLAGEGALQYSPLRAILHRAAVPLNVYCCP